jgi:hypothetical protein
LEESIKVEVPNDAWRSRLYADGKPRPLLRGVIHGILALALLPGIGILVAATRDIAMALGLAGKFATYAASATFHLYPFSSTIGVTRAFIVDLVLVPAWVCGTVAPFVSHPVDMAREGGLAAGVLVLNALLVWRQTRGQRGLRTQPGRSEAPRSMLVIAYVVWAFTFIGLTVGVANVEWGTMLALTILAGGLSQPVTQAYELEPISSRVPWHAARVWSFHEDFHLVLACTDAVWLALALRYADIARETRISNFTASSIPNSDEHLDLSSAHRTF